MTRSSRRKGQGGERFGICGIDARVFVVVSLLGAALLGLGIGLFVQIVRRPYRELGVAIMLCVALLVVCVACKKRRDPRDIVPVIFATVWDSSSGGDEIQTAAWASAEDPSTVVCAVAVPDEPEGARAERSPPSARPPHPEQLDQ